MTSFRGGLNYIYREDRLIISDVNKNYIIHGTDLIIFIEREIG
jgi:hypothetical protein